MANSACPKCGSHLFDGEYCRICEFHQPIKFKWLKNRGITQEGKETEK